MNCCPNYCIIKWSMFLRFNVILHKCWYTVYMIVLLAFHSILYAKRPESVYRHYYRYIGFQWIYRWYQLSADGYFFFLYTLYVSQLSTHRRCGIYMSPGHRYDTWKRHVSIFTISKHPRTRNIKRRLLPLSRIPPPQRVRLTSSSQAIASFSSSRHAS